MEAIDPYHKEFVQFLDGVRNVPSVQEQKLTILDMFHDASLTHFNVRAVIYTNTSYEEMLAFLDIRERAEAARNGGAISGSECDAWLEQLEQAGRAGHFFMSTNHYIVYGCKAM